MDVRGLDGRNDSWGIREQINLKSEIYLIQRTSCPPSRQHASSPRALRAVNSLT